MKPPYVDGYKNLVPPFTFKGMSEETVEMLKTCFCLVLASWMTGCIMMIVYAREIAEFMLERMQ